MSVARCYVVKNRQQEVVPYDKNRRVTIVQYEHTVFDALRNNLVCCCTRVEMPTTKDDYINASHIRDLTEHAPRYEYKQS